MRGADLQPTARPRSTEIGTALRRPPFAGNVGAGQVRAHHDRRRGARGRRHGRDAGDRAKAERQVDHLRRRARRPAQNVREAGEDLKVGVAGAAARTHRCAPPSSASSPRSASARCRSTGRCASRSSPPATSCSSIGTPLGEGEIYDSNRYTLHGMLTRLGCEMLDMGVVRDDPALLEARVPRGRRQRRRGHHQRRRLGGRSRLREAADGQAGRGGVLEDRDEARAARSPTARSAARISSACRAIRSR